MTNPIVLITGVGPGTGAAMVKLFAERGYRVAMVARDKSRLDTLSEELPNTFSYPCDVGNSEEIEKVVTKIKKDLGDPEIFIHNAVTATFGNFLEINPEDLVNNFHVNTMALLHFSRQLAPNMIASKKGNIVVTGNTSATRGKRDFSGFAPSKAAQRILAESIAREVGPNGVHVSYIMIDAVIDVPWAREKFNDKSDDFFIKPSDIAEQVWATIKQPRSCWSFNVELRPFCETW